MPETAGIGLRWTVGDVSALGFEALRLSIWGAWRMFGPDAAYAVCINSLPLAVARERTGDVPDAVAWHVCDGRMPAFLRAHLDDGLAEGVAWKFAPLRLFPDRFEIALDNDCILWAMPAAIRRWLAGAERGACVLAEDVVAAYGRMAPLCATASRNTGIRGLPPGFDLADALRDVLAEAPGPIVSELDEQGLQVAALSRAAPPLVVRLDEVAISSPNPPHVKLLGSCGAHFVGLNVRHERPFYDRAALDRIARHWERWRGDIYRAIDLAPRPPELLET
jgi:hypothetical protein